MKLTHIERYEIRDVIGVGGMGSVYSAFDPRTQQVVAIKVPNLGIQNAGDVRVRAERELKVLLSLRNHPGIVTVYDFTSEPFGIVMELLQGETLHQLLKQHEEGFPLERALEIIKDICGAVGYAHHLGVLHRDLKPGNIIITELGSQKVLKVMDFGLSALLQGSDERVTQAGLVMGTPAYMAPEQCLNEELGPHTDVYAIGLLFFELLTGSMPFDKGSEFELMRAQVDLPVPPPSRRKPGIPLYVDALVERATQKAPGHRFPDCDAFVEAIEEAQLRLKADKISGPISFARTELPPQLDDDVVSIPAGRPPKVRSSAEIPRPAVAEATGSGSWVHRMKERPLTPALVVAVLVALAAVVFWPRPDAQPEAEPVVPEPVVPEPVAEPEEPLPEGDAPIEGDRCGPCSLDLWEMVDGELVCSGETPCEIPLEHALTACDALSVCPESQLCQHGYCVDARAPDAPLAAAATVPSSQWLDAFWPELVTLPTVTTVDSSKGYARLHRDPDRFNGRRSDRVPNGAHVHVMETTCGTDLGRWARVRVLAVPHGEDDDALGEEGWIRRQVLEPHGNGCCDGRDFDCGWRSETEADHFFEAEMEPTAQEAVDDANLRSSPIYSIHIDNRIGRVQAGDDIVVEREICTPSGYRWAWVTSGTPEEPVAGWALRMDIGGDVPACCLGRGSVDPDCQ